MSDIEKVKDRVKDQLKDVPGIQGVGITNCIVVNVDHTCDIDAIPGMVDDVHVVFDVMEAPVLQDIDYFTVPRGQVTFDAEGSERRGRYFSRVAHVPGKWSGVTIGRGYDCKEKSPSKILQDMLDAEVDAPIADGFAGASGLKGTEAEKYVRRALYDTEITPRQQWLLFNAIYDELEQDVLRICTKSDVVRKYGATQWNALDPLIRDVIVDLRFRGDYTPKTRLRVQPLLVEGDTAGIVQLMDDHNYWVGSFRVPTDRYKRRAAHIASLA